MFPGAKLITHWGVETKPAVTLPAMRFKRMFFHAGDDTVLGMTPCPTPGGQWHCTGSLLR